MTEERRFHTRYPPRAVALIVGVVLLAVAEVLLMGLLVMPLIPLIPIFFAAVIGHGCLLTVALEYAKSQARIEPVGSPRPETRSKTQAPPHGSTPQPA